MQSAFSVADLDEVFAGRLRRAIFDGLARLDALPRNHSFWSDTNGRPTRYKLGQVLEHWPTEEWACWAYAAMSVMRCDNHFGLPAWRALFGLGRLDPGWPMKAAYHVLACSGYDPGPELVQFLGEIGAPVPAWAAHHKTQE